MSHFLERWARESDDNQRLVAVENFILDVTEQIWEQMEKREITKASLAEKLGKSKPYVSQLLSGSRNMTLRTLAEIAFAMDVTATISLQEVGEVLDDGEYVETVNIGRIPKTHITLIAENQDVYEDRNGGWTAPRPASDLTTTAA